MAFQTTSKHFQKAVILVLLITFTTLLYHYQRFFSYPPIHRISQNISNRTHSPLSSSSSFQHEYSIKPIAYIFPQYYPFPENDKIWGTNFTEWDNVRKATHNNHGLETIRPDESVGYYNGVDYSTRERQGRFLRESGFYGAAFHHYWFAGKPVMDGVTKAMLEDGEPRIPFMLSWANEPWTARWDGEDSSETFIAQDYGNIEDWRKHFEYLLPFFKHPLYIRSGGRIQFMVYKPSHCGHIGPHMFAAWRQWALDEGLGGLEVIETRWGSGGEKSSNQAIPDAISEFQPHVAGFDHAHHSVTDRVSRVYHRGTLVCWDATPRHVNDGQGRAQPTCHPKTWMWNIVEMMRKIKSEPNPLGAENFLFVNALNEWGEGNALEPSKQFGDGYGKAMKGAIEISEKEHIWQHQEISQGILRAEELKSLENATTDVCVLIRTYRDQADDKTYRLSHTLRSLQAQTNNNWRALVFRTDETDWWNLNEVVFTTLDPRIKLITLDKDIQGAYSKQDAAFTATDWMIKNLTTADPLCASARYLLVTNGGVTYEKNTFEVAVPKRQNPDLIGLNVESRDTIFNHTALQGGVWDDRCKRLEDPELNLCAPSGPTLDTVDLTATLFSLPRFLSESHSFSAFTPDHPSGRQPQGLLNLLTTSSHWTWYHSRRPSDPSSSLKHASDTSSPLSISTKKECHVRHNPAYTTCIKTGNFWFDSPWYNETGCFTQSEFGDRFGVWDVFDLQFYRQNGGCMRYKKASYLKKMPVVQAGNGTVKVDAMGNGRGRGGEIDRKKGEEDLATKHSKAKAEYLAKQKAKEKAEKEEAEKEQETTP